jgi:hypothetical protein
MNEMRLEELICLALRDQQPSAEQIKRMKDRILSETLADYSESGKGNRLIHCSFQGGVFSY